MVWRGVPFTLWQSVPFADRDAWHDFTFAHWLHHAALAMKTKTRLVLLDDLRRHAGPHARMHQDLANALRTAMPLTLEDYDLSERGQFEDFMSSHAQIHSNLNAVAGL